MAGVLAVIDRDQGTDDEYIELLGFCVGLRNSFGAMDLVLRGTAVDCARQVPEGRGEPPRPQRFLRGLIRVGVRVYADGADLAARGLPVGRLLDDVVVADTSAQAASWPEYSNVWFL